MSYAPDETSQEIFMDGTWLQGVILTGVTYGVVLTLFIMTARLLIQQMTGATYKRRLFFLSYITCIFILGTLYMVSAAGMTQLAFINDRNFPGGPSNFEKVMFSVPIDGLGNVCFVLAEWFSESLMVWRCLVIYRGCHLPIWIVMGVPFLMLGASLVLGVLLIIQISAPNASPWASAGIDVSMPYLIVSLALNIIVTVAIVLRLLVYRHRISQILGPNHGSQYTSIVAMLVESASLYSLFSLLLVIPFAIDNPIQNVSLQMLGEIQIITPLLIIFRSAQGRAWGEGTSTRVMASNTGSWKSLSRMPQIRFSRDRTDPSSVVGYGGSILDVHKDWEARQRDEEFLSVV